MRKFCVIFVLSLMLGGCAVLPGILGGFAFSVLESLTGDVVVKGVESLPIFNKASLTIDDEIVCWGGDQAVCNKLAKLKSTK